MTLTDTQLVLLSAASQHADGLLPRPDKLAGAALAKMQASLVRSGMVESVPILADQPCWYRDEGDAPVGLRIMAVGLAALGIEPPSVRNVGVFGEHDDTPRPGETEAPTPPTAARTFRPGSKLALLVNLLSSAEATSVDALVMALAWQPHTVRAALTRLRQGGFTLTSSKDGQKRTVYRITALPSPASGEVGEAR